MKYQFLSLLVALALLMPLPAQAQCHPSPSPSSSSGAAGLLFKYVKILSPQPGEVLGSGGFSVQSGSTYPITWKAISSNVKFVDILYSPDLGETYYEIVTHYPNTGLYDWVLPNIHTTQALIRINTFGENNWNYGSVVSLSPFSIFNASGSFQTYPILQARACAGIMTPCIY